MAIKSEHYKNKKFLFACKSCSRLKKIEFTFQHSQFRGRAVLKCSNCGYLINRSKKLLDEQLKNQEND